MILQTLYQQCVKRDVRFFNEFYCLDLLLTDDGRTAGSWRPSWRPASPTSSARSRCCSPPAVTAGCSASRRTHALTGDGPVAFRRGIPLEDMEFFQFHPTGLYRLGRAAVRGRPRRGRGDPQPRRRAVHGALRADDQGPGSSRRGVPFDLSGDEGGPGPRPRGDYVLLDLTHLDPRILEEKLPTSPSSPVYLQVEPKREPVPIQPTAHYAMGGIPTDVHARS